MEHTHTVWSIHTLRGAVSDATTTAARGREVLKANVRVGATRGQRIELISCANLPLDTICEYLVNIEKLAEFFRRAYGGYRR